MNGIMEIKKYCLFTTIIFVFQTCLFGQYEIQSVPKEKVDITDGFWFSRLMTNHNATIPHIFNNIQGPGYLQNFKIAGGYDKGGFVNGTANSSDDIKVYKYLEAAAYSGALFDDKELIAHTDALWDTVLAAQQTDGYLCSRFILGEEDLKMNRIGYGYQMYAAGHLMEAAIAHYNVTKDRKAMDAAIRFADLIDSLVGPGDEKIQDVPGHQNIELALIRLFHVTLNEKYLKLSKFLIEERGNIDKRGSYGIRALDHKPLLEHEEAVGHAVRATYSYCAMADLAALLKATDYHSAVDRIWENVSSKKLYITGAFASRYEFPSESIGSDYELPNKEAYAETCGHIGFMLWNKRMYQLTGEKKYLDVLERTLYNAFLAGISLDGKKFSYCNPLEYNPLWQQERVERLPWRPVPCCPPNIARFIPQLCELIYGQTGNEIFINLFINSSADISIEGGSVNIKQKSLYPWDGHIEIQVNPAGKSTFPLCIRIPGWAQNQPVPGDLYHYSEQRGIDISLSMDGKKAPVDISDGYIIIDRTWNHQTTITVDFPMEIRRVISNGKIVENAHKTALERGPIVYCFEGADNHNSALNIFLPDTSNLSFRFEKDILNGCGVISGTGFKIDKYSKEQFIQYHGEVTAIPYYAWQNRGLKEMAVWINRMKQDNH